MRRQDEAEKYVELGPGLIAQLLNGEEPNGDALFVYEDKDWLTLFAEFRGSDDRQALFDKLDNTQKKRIKRAQIALRRGAILPLKQAVSNVAKPKPTKKSKPKKKPTDTSTNKLHPTEIADAICETEIFARDEGDKPWVYHNGVYEPHGARRIKACAKAIVQDLGKSKQWTNHKAREAQAWIVADAPFLEEIPPLDTINLTNGLLNVDTRDLPPHDSKFMSPVQLPIAYDPKAQCPYWEQFVSEVFPEDAQDLPWELAAWGMLPITSIQKALLLLGPACNGKSRFLEGLRSFIGRGNTTAISLHKLEGNPFAASRLVGKLANICPDLPSAHLESTSTFKAITGGDLINAEYKYGKNFDFLCYSRLFFSANHPPRSQDRSAAFFRRWIVVPFNVSFEGREIASTVIDARLADPRELSGVLNKALDALPHVLERSITETPSMREAWHELRTVTDPIAVWINRSTIDKPGIHISKSKLWTAYNTDAEEHGRPPCTSTAFSIALNRVRPDLQDGQRKVGGKEGVRCWLNIGLKAEQERFDGLGGDSNTA